MGAQIIKSAIKNHNRTQLEYFDQKIKQTMVPVDSRYVKRHLAEFLKIADLRRNESILEVGCGMGKFTIPLLKCGFNVTGLDLSGFLLQKLLEHNDNRFNVNLICSDILEIPEDYNNRFDHIIGFFTLHHFHHLQTYFQAMRRVLKPGGQMIFLEPNAFNPLYYFQILFSPTMSWAGDKGVLEMRKKKFQEATEYANLEGLEIYKYGFFPPFVVNNDFGKKVEELLERSKVLKSISAFQIIKIKKPLV